jgi:O-acetyl-ADP-ribose deacetylase (regulator of RNase III)
MRTQVTYTVGDATQPATRPAVIAHVCNDIGGWGRGFVLALSKQWVEPETAYREWASRNDGTFALGEVQFVPVETRLWIANMIAQHDVRVKAGVPPIRYDALRRALQKVAHFCSANGASVHMPRIGCGLAGGDWSIVSGIIESELAAQGIAATVYDLFPVDAGIRTP